MPGIQVGVMVMLCTNQRLLPSRHKPTSDVSSQAGLKASQSHQVSPVSPRRVQLHDQEGDCRGCSERVCQQLWPGWPGFLSCLIGGCLGPRLSEPPAELGRPHVWPRPQLPHQRQALLCITELEVCYLTVTWEHVHVCIAPLTWVEHSFGPFASSPKASLPICLSSKCFCLKLAATTNSANLCSVGQTSMSLSGTLQNTLGTLYYGKR